MKRRLWQLQRQPCAASLRRRRRNRTCPSSQRPGIHTVTQAPTPRRLMKNTYITVNELKHKRTDDSHAGETGTRPGNTFRSRKVLKPAFSAHAAVPSAVEEAWRQRIYTLLPEGGHGPDIFTVFSVRTDFEAPQTLLNPTRQAVRHRGRGSLTRGFALRCFLRYPTNYVRIGNAV